jgi:hypothetical protein
MVPMIKKTEVVSEFRSRHRIRQVLLVCIYQHHGIAKLILFEKSGEFISCFRYPFSITGIDDEDNALSVLVIFW